MHTRALSDSHSLAPSLSYWSIFYCFFKIFTLTMTCLGRMVGARNILNKNEGIINHILLLLFFIIFFFFLFGWFFTQFCFFLFKTGWDFTQCRMKLKKFLYGNKYQTHGLYIYIYFFF